MPMCDRVGSSMGCGPLHGGTKGRDETLGRPGPATVRSCGGVAAGHYRSPPGRAHAPNSRPPAASARKQLARLAGLLARTAGKATVAFFLPSSPLPGPRPDAQAALDSEPFRAVMRRSAELICMVIRTAPDLRNSAPKAACPGSVCRRPPGTAKPWKGPCRLSSLSHRQRRRTAGQIGVEVRGIGTPRARSVPARKGIHLASAR